MSQLITGPMLTGNAWLQLALYMAVLIACAVPLGGYMARVFQGERHLLSPVLGWLENAIYAVMGTKPEAGRNWTASALRSNTDITDAKNT